MPKVKKETLEKEEKPAPETSTKLKPGQGPEETQINTKVKAAIPTLLYQEAKELYIKES